MKRETLREHFADADKRTVVNLIYDEWERPGSTERTQRRINGVPLEDLFEKYGDWEFDGAYTVLLTKDRIEADVWATATDHRAYREPEADDSMVSDYGSEHESDFSEILEGRDISFKKEAIPPSIKATVVLHLIEQDDFEVNDVGFDDAHYDLLCKEFEEETDEKNREAIANRLSLLDSLRDDAACDLSEYSDITKRICKELWEKEKTERFCCVNVSIWYSTSVDMFGEVDTDVEYEYKESSFDKEWEKLDLLQKGSKIYPISYEENGSTYTITNVFEVHDNEYQKPGIYYQLHSDKLSIMTGYYPLLTDLVDNSRYFSSEEEAHKAYVRMKKNCPLQAGFVKYAEESDLEL